jgi:D-glycero-alpha-D-manno-heptose 1-phosphate guanylyltransferase
MSLNMLVLAGGYGKRLRSVVSDVPKSLAPINGVPFLELQIKHWISQGQNNFIFLLHYESDQIINFLIKNKSGFLQGIDIRWIVEGKPLGTGGSILNAINEFKLTNDFLVVNSDTWLSSGLKELRSSIAPTIGIVKVNKESRYGVVNFDATSRITTFSEKAISPCLGGEDWINAGIYKLPVSFFLLDRGKQFSLEYDVLAKNFQNTVIRVCKLDTDFIDIGIPSDYKKFCETKD